MEALHPAVMRPDMPGTFFAEVYAHRTDLLRIARLQLRDEHLAADVVQETFLAALKSGQTFAGKSKLKTWLIGILKFKIADALRSRARDPVSISDLTSDLEEETDTQDIDALFDEQGLWRSQPKDWDDPAFIASQRDFLRIMDLCLEKLPPNTARVFMLRELFGMESEEICDVASISHNHLGVLLYRARMSLRRCLEINWLSPA